MSAADRKSLPSTSLDFALPQSTSVLIVNPPTPDDVPSPNPLQYRFRRASLLAAPKAQIFSEARLSSPLATAFSLPVMRGGDGGTDSPTSSSSSGNPTPPLGPPLEPPPAMRAKRPRRSGSPGTPLRRSKSPIDFSADSVPGAIVRRRSLIKPHRILHLLAEETRPEDNEVKSEAAFQRLVANSTGSPIQPRTPRTLLDRGRYPEEAGGEEEGVREATPSDDGEDEPTFAFPPPSSEPIMVPKPATPVGSVNGDDMSISESPGGFMDIDPPSASPMVGGYSPAQWRYTPPPTATSVVRTNKRKLEDRYDPYPNAAKRRAVSPSYNPHRRDSQSRPTIGNTRFPIPIAIPTSSASSTTSSPTVSSSQASVSLPRQMSISSSHVSSPIMRPTIGMPSPVLRPILRASWQMEGEEREVEGAGEGVNGLTIAGT